MVLGSLWILLSTGLIVNNNYGIWTGLILGCVFRSTKTSPLPSA